ncbi:MAG: glycosyltransferase family 2 protein [Pyrinomonadaceae bacterium]|nr:glycosyltransferase family 2 protein [Pyrinomonadaceae bacterium]
MDSALSISTRFCQNSVVKVSACIITLNEEENIGDAIKSVSWADEVIVVDSGSTDKTIEISEYLGAKTYSKDWMGFGKQKQFAVEKCENDWVFSLDADERASGELQSAILELKADGFPADGYRISRLTYYMDRPIRHAGWYPDWQLRLFNRKQGKWSDSLIHESFQLSDGAKVEKLKADILHYTVKNAAHHHRMIGERYAPFAAEQMFLSGRRTSPFRAAAAGCSSFFQTYVLKAGFLEGFPGFCISSFAAHHAFLKHVMLWEMQNSKNK